MSITPEGHDSRRPDGRVSEGAPRACPECGTINSVRAASCWRCHAPLGGDGETYDPVIPRAEPAMTALATGIILTLLVLLVGASILWMEVVNKSASGVIVAVFFLGAIPALLYLFRSAYTNWNTAGARTLVQVAGAVVGAFFLSFVVAIAAAIMFVATCVPVGVMGFSSRGDEWITMAFCAGTLGAGLAAFLAVYLIFRRKRPPV
jgi:hypothetical protein